MVCRWKTFMHSDGTRLEITIPNSRDEHIASPWAPSNWCSQDCWFPVLHPCYLKRGRGRHACVLPPCSTVQLKPSWSSWREIASQWFLVFTNTMTRFSSTRSRLSSSRRGLSLSLHMTTSCSSNSRQGNGASRTATPTHFIPQAPISQSALAHNSSSRKTVF